MYVCTQKLHLIYTCIAPVIKISEINTIKGQIFSHCQSSFYSTHNLLLCVGITLKETKHICGLLYI